MRGLGRQTVLILSIATAIVVTALSVWVDSHLFYRKQSDHALSWARQVSVQAEGLALFARKMGIQDSMGWATGFLAQGVEPKVMQITKIQTARAEPEFFEFKGDAFEYVKVSLPEKGIGLKIRINFPFRGFLDTRSQITHDFMLICFVALWALAILGALGVKIQKIQAEELRIAQEKEAQAWKNADEIELRRQAEVLAKEGEVQAVKDKVRTWSVDAKGVLTDLGLNVRDMVKEANALAQAASRSREHVLPLRDRVHAKIQEIRTQRQKLKAEAMEPKLKQWLDAVLRGMEVSLEPIATDADLAVQSYDTVFASTESMNQAINKTKGSVLSQAKLLQGMKEPVVTPETNSESNQTQTAA